MSRRYRNGDALRPGKNVGTTGALYAKKASRLEMLPTLPCPEPGAAA